MFKRFVEVTLVFSLAFAAQTAQAFFDPPWITPVAPRAGETVSVNIRGGICDSIFFSPGYPQVTRQGNAIHLLEYGHHWDTQDLCIYDIGVLSEPVGAYEPGNYTLTVEMIYDDFLYGPTIMTLGVVPFTVTETPPFVPIPTLGTAGQFVLFMLLSRLAACAFRSYQRTGQEALHSYASSYP